MKRTILLAVAALMISAAMMAQNGNQIRIKIRFRQQSDQVQNRSERNQESVWYPDSETGP